MVLIMLITSMSPSYAIFDAPRKNVKWTADNVCETGEFKFDPYGHNKDITWEFSNPTCIGFMTVQGAAIVGAGQLTKYFCKPTNALGISFVASEEAKDPYPDNPFLGPDTIFKSIHRATLCGKRSQEYSHWQSEEAFACVPPFTYCALATAQVALALKDVISCCAAYSSYVVAVGVGAATLGGIYAFAEKSYKTARVCGHDWNNWKTFNIDGDESTSEDSMWRRGVYQGSYQDCLESMFIRGSNSCSLSDVDGIPALKATITNKYYREFLYGGKEYTDDACENPTTWDENRKMAILGYSGDDQRYYMRGPGVISGYSCHRFVLSGNPKFDEGATKAFDCCKERSQNTICIESEGSVISGYSHTFCRFGQKCSLQGVQYDIYPAKEHADTICARTYSVCPYNHPLGGGTETRDFDEGANGHPSSEIKNFCQYMKHCAKIPALPKIKISNLTGAYISAACRDLKGDSQNVYSFNAELLPTGNARGFSAPIVQCFKETVENLLLNKAGDSRCLDPDEVPDRHGECKGGVAFKKGDSLKEPSFFIKIQDKLRAVIKMVLTVSITFFGVSVLLGGKPIEKKQLFSYIVKIALLMYFALGNAWQSGFVEGILGSSHNLAQIMMRIDDEKAPEHKKDGCQFPRFNYNSDIADKNRYNNPRYPDGKEYLAIWDTLDCKLALALGYGPQVSVPNLAIMVVAGMITPGAIGVIFFIAAFVFAILLISLILRAMHIFLLSTVAIVILIYVSPITISLAMFQKTKGIFDGWVKQILGLALQPVILFAYLGMFIAIFDIVVIADAKFTGDGKEVPKAIQCKDEVICKKCRIIPATPPTMPVWGDQDAIKKYREEYDAYKNAPQVCEEVAGCTEEEMEEADPNKVDIIPIGDNSIYCIFGIAHLKTYYGFEAIGIGLPMLAEFNKHKLDTLVKAAFLMFIFSSFMDQVSTLAVKLVGGAQLKSNSPSAAKLTGQAKDITRGVQKRGTRATEKALWATGKGLFGAARGGARTIGTLGKFVNRRNRKEAKDEVADSKGSGSNAFNSKKPNDRS